MSYNNAFDRAAAGYDQDFTSSLTGSAQRNLVHKYLEKNLDSWNNMHILELNCGTGEDAIFFAKKGARVLATDLSEKMLEIADEKIKSAGFQNKICIKKADTAEIKSGIFKTQFDLVFSNFGGLNCIIADKLRGLSAEFRKILKPSGRMIFIIMPPFTLWEIFYFGMKGKIREAFRRMNKSGIDVKIKDSSVRAFYYSPAKIKKIFSKDFKMIRIKPVGFFIPPSYLENFFKRRIKIFTCLKKMERLAANFPFLSSLSDHYIIDMEAKR